MTLTVKHDATKSERKPIDYQLICRKGIVN